jgi:hypothetical protein
MGCAAGCPGRAAGSGAQFRFRPHDAGSQGLPAVQVRHGHPDWLRGALQELRQRVSQDPGIPAAQRERNASRKLQVAADGHLELPAGNHSRSSAGPASIPSAESAGVIPLARLQASRSASYAWSSGAIGWPDPLSYGACWPAQIAAAIATGCPMRSYSPPAATSCTDPSHGTGRTGG